MAGASAKRSKKAREREERKRAEKKLKPSRGNGLLLLFSSPDLSPHFFWCGQGGGGGRRGMCM